MSDYNPFVGDDGPLEGSPSEDVGVATGDGQPTDQVAYEEPKEYLEVDQVADRYVRVKVDGQDLEVPLKEALQGYSRTADYTRKTQDLAAQRQQADYAIAVQRALQAQPEETLRLLSRQYGVDLGPSQSPPSQQGWEQPSYDDGDDNPYMDPVERRLAQQQQAIDQLAQRDAQRAADQQLQLAIGGLQRKYQLDDTTVREVVGVALQNRMGPEAFEMIYKNLAFDRAQAARAEAYAQRQQRDSQREIDRERSQQLVGQGRSANGAGGPQPGASDGRMSINEAFEAAERELNVRF